MVFRDLTIRDLQRRLTKKPVKEAAVKTRAAMHALDHAADVGQVVDSYIADLILATFVLADALGIDIETVIKQRTMPNGALLRPVGGHPMARPTEEQVRHWTKEELEGIAREFHGPQEAALKAELEAAKAALRSANRDVALLDFLELKGRVSFSFENASIEFPVPSEFEGADTVREVVHAALVAE